MVLVRVHFDFCCEDRENRSCHAAEANAPIADFTRYTSAFVASR